MTPIPAPPALLELLRVHGLSPDRDMDSATPAAQGIHVLDRAESLLAADDAFLGDELAALSTMAPTS